METARPTGVGRGCLSLFRATPGWVPVAGDRHLPDSVRPGSIGAPPSVPPVVGAVRVSPIPKKVAAVDTKQRGSSLSGSVESIPCKRHISGRDEG